tara:strand:- start:4 stop:189 length:186 start_codon:yes stop_codon:yes gene_type:complete
VKRHQKPHFKRLYEFFGNNGELGVFGIAGSGGLAHLGERLICIQEVAGSSPVSSTTRGALV